MSKLLPEDPPEESLDPSDQEGWSEFRRLAHRMVDDMLDHLSRLPDQPAWRAAPPEIRRSFNQAVPRTGVGAVAAYENICDWFSLIPTATCIRASGAGFKATVRYSA